MKSNEVMSYRAMDTAGLLEEKINKAKQGFPVISTKDCHIILETLAYFSSHTVHEVQTVYGDGRQSHSTIPEPMILITRATRLAVDVCYGLYHFEEQESNEACQAMLDKANAQAVELADTLKQLSVAFYKAK